MHENPPMPCRPDRRAMAKGRLAAISLSMMIKTLFISTGLVGMTAFSGMALSMAHDIAFSSAAPVAANEVVQASFALPAPQEAETTIMATGSMSLEATPGEVETIPAILESTGPHNRAAGKSIATASIHAVAASVAPQAREDQQIRPDTAARAPSDAVVTVSAPVFQRSSGLGYTPVASVRNVATPTPAPAAPVVQNNSPTPDYLIGVFR